VQPVRDGHGAGELDVAERRRPLGIRHQDFVARFEETLTGGEHAMDAAARDQDFVGAADRDPGLRRSFSTSCSTSNGIPVVWT
jgi:hypothetical protein